ncbi:MAG: hypothetical protein WC767_01735 [Candidatus Paceibacterota bacterium]|jgi:hypothetical protein
MNTVIILLILGIILIVWSGFALGKRGKLNEFAGIFAAGIILVAFCFWVAVTTKSTSIAEWWNALSLFR